LASRQLAALDRDVVLVSMSSQDERRRLEDISAWYSNRDWGFYTKLVHMGFRTLAPYFSDGSCLEIGCADGEMTRFLVERFSDLTVVDAAPAYIAAVTKLAPAIEGHVSLIEEWKAPRQYDNIVFAHVLEHVLDPVETLRMLRRLLTSTGRLHVVVPNALSFHRLAGVKMGLLNLPTDLNEADLSVGHRRVYEPSSLRADVAAAGLAIEAFGGIFLKPLANAQIEEAWSDDLIEAYFQLGQDFPELCGELFVVCRSNAANTL
jgi:2-polyprenyl-3-methyl-5-hydroxy-6-metoxy-1,4-benzoquinol methylase